MECSRQQEVELGVYNIYKWMSNGQTLNCYSTVWMVSSSLRLSSNNDQLEVIATTSSVSELSYCDPVEYKINLIANSCKNATLDWTLCMTLTEFVPQFVSNIWVGNKLNCFGNFLGYGFTWPHYTRNLVLSGSCKTVAGRHTAHKTPDQVTWIVCIVKDVVQHFSKKAEL